MVDSRALDATSAGGSVGRPRRPRSRPTPRVSRTCACFSELSTLTVSRGSMTYSGTLWREVQSDKANAGRVEKAGLDTPRTGPKPVSSSATRALKPGLPEKQVSRAAGARTFARGARGPSLLCKPNASSLGALPRRSPMPVAAACSCDAWTATQPRAARLAAATGVECPASNAGSPRCDRSHGAVAPPRLASVADKRRAGATQDARRQCARAGLTAAPAWACGAVRRRPGPPRVAVTLPWFVVTMRSTQPRSTARRVLSGCDGAAPSATRDSR